MAKHLELDVLRTFEAVVREGSFARAAERMCLTAPAISLQMKRLDAVLGGDVFYKDGRGKSLTDKGQRLLEHARRMLHLNDLALSEFTQTNFRGRVRLGVAQDFAEGALIMLLREIQDAHREVQIDLVVDLNRRIHAAFERGELDVAIATSDPLGEPLGESLLDTELIWIAARDFKLTPGAPLPLVLFPEPCIVRDIVLRALVEHGISWRPACVSTSLEGLLSATKAGLGITVRSPQQLTRDLVKVSPGLGLPMLPDVSVAMRINDNGPSSQALTRHIAELVRNVVLTNTLVGAKLPVSHAFMKETMAKKNKIPAAARTARSLSTGTPYSGIRRPKLKNESVMAEVWTNHQSKAYDYYHILVHDHEITSEDPYAVVADESSWPMRS